MSKGRKKAVISTVIDPETHDLIQTFEDNSQIIKKIDGTMIKVCPMCGAHNAWKQKVCQGNAEDQKKKFRCGTVLEDIIYDKGGWMDFDVKPKSDRSLT